MLLGRGSSTYDFDYLVGNVRNYAEPKIGFNIKQAKAGCGVDCAIEEPTFTVEHDGRSWSDAIKLQTYRSHQRLTFKVYAEGEVSVDLGQTDDCRRAGTTSHGCFELVIGTGANKDQLCLRPREEFNRANGLCTEATGTPFFDASGDKSKTYTVEWDLDTSDQSAHQLSLSVFDHDLDDAHRLDASWSLDPATYADNHTAVEYMSFNGKDNDATFLVWVDYYPDVLFEDDGSIDFADDYAGELITKATVGIVPASNPGNVIVRVGDTARCRWGTCIDIKFDAQEFTKKAWVFDWSSDKLVVTDWETKATYMEVDIPEDLLEITHISMDGERNDFSVWVGNRSPDKHATHNRPTWISDTFIDSHHTRFEAQVFSSDDDLVDTTSHVRMVCSSTLGTGVTDDIVSVTFKSKDDGLLLSDEQQDNANVRRNLARDERSTCMNDQVSFAAIVHDFDYEVNTIQPEKVMLSDLVLQKEPKCPMRCSLTSEDSAGSAPLYVSAFDSQTGDWMLSTRDRRFVSTSEKLTLECESTESHMENRVAKVSFSVRFA